MSNFIVTQIKVIKHQYNGFLKKVRSDQHQFDLNLAVPAPKSLPEPNKYTLLALAHHLQANAISEAIQSDLAEQLSDYVDDSSDFESLSMEFAEFLISQDAEKASQLLQTGFEAYQNMLTHGAISQCDWKKNMWGDDRVESVDVIGRSVRIYGRSSFYAFAHNWAVSSGHDFDISIIDSGCHHSHVLKYRNGKLDYSKRDDKADLKNLSMELLGYKKNELI